jgi:2-methylisocitrate lyase-like PEP mutase family enzyme
MSTTARLRQLLQTGPMIVAPFILNAMHAKIAETVGFPAVYMTGAGTAAERGFPDVGLLTMSEMIANAGISPTQCRSPSSVTPTPATATR